MSIESDEPEFLAGVRLGETLGTPVCIMVRNKDHVNWLRDMSPLPQEEAPLRSVTIPRPGHADLSGVEKYGFKDVRSVLERASARETVARVAAGAVCKRLLEEFGVTVRGRVVQIGGEAVSNEAGFEAEAADWDAVESCPVGCGDGAAGARMCAAIDHAKENGESLGGVFEIWCWGLCPGLGGYAAADERLDGRLLGALGSIPAVKGAEIGNAFENAGLPGSLVHDPMAIESFGGRKYVKHASNRAGGIEGGMTTGSPVVIRVAMKPIPTMSTPLGSVDLATMTDTAAYYERSDVCAVPAARVVGEAVAAFVLASAYMEKFGGDSLAQTLSAIKDYENTLQERGLWRRSSS